MVRKTILSQKLQNGEKKNEPVARQEYIKLNAKDHKKYRVVETELFVCCENPIFGASPDGIVGCVMNQDF